jgi:hypothetical protein
MTDKEQIKTFQEGMKLLSDELKPLIANNCVKFLSKFNNCREADEKKSKKKGCYKEFTEYESCVLNVLNQVANSKEYDLAFKNRQIPISKENFVKYLSKDYLDII